MDSWIMQVAPLVMSAIAIVISLFVYLQSTYLSKQGARRATTARLLDRCVQINEAFERHQVLGPIATNEGLGKDYQTKAIMFLYHLIILYDVFAHQEELGPRTVEAYRNWARTLIAPWLERDPDLKNILDQFIQHHDLLGEDFTAWILPYLRS